MGTWNPKPFGNDTALGWLDGLEACTDTSYLGNTIDRISRCSDPLNATDGEEAVAAAAVIAAASSEPIRQVPEAARAWIRESAFAPSATLISTALNLLQRVLAESELRQLWEESGSPSQWLKATGTVVENLRKAAESPPLKREAKPKASPRLLHKMIAAHVMRPDERFRSRIRTRLLSLKDVNAPSKETDYQTPLCMLARTSLVEEARLLIQRRADLNCDSGMGTPLTVACGSGQREMAQALLNAGAELFKEMIIDETSGLSIELVSDRNARPIVFRFAPGLFAAARSGTPAIIDLLLSRGADPHQVDLNGETLLHIASRVGNVEALRHLIALGLDVNRTTSDSCDSALHYAVRANHIDCARILLESKADPNLIAKYGDGTALDIAADSSDRLFQLIRTFGGLSAREIQDRTIGNDARPL